MNNEKIKSLKASLKQQLAVCKQHDREYQQLDAAYRKLDKLSDKAWEKVYQIENRLLDLSEADNA